MKFKGFETKSGGVYVIRNKINGKVYVGRTSNFKRRYYQYLYDFKNQRCRSINEYLLRSYAKYGSDNFEFEPVWYCFTEDESVILEVEYMERYNSLDRLFGYNLRCDAQGGMIVSKETSDKISARLKKEWANGTRSKHSEKLKASWEGRDKVAQGELFSKLLTKWVYYIEDDFSKPLVYRDLCEHGFKSAVGKFKKDSEGGVMFKGVSVTRKPFKETLYRNV